MNDIDTSELTWDDWDELQRPAPETTDFDTVVAAAVSRRGFLCGLVAIGSGAAAMGLFPGSPAHAQNASPLASARLQHKQMARYMCPKDTAGKS